MDVHLAAFGGRLLTSQLHLLRPAYRPARPTPHSRPNARPNAHPPLAQPAAAGPPSVQVGSYLPEAEGMPGFRLYTPDAKKTPAIRAGVIAADPEFYRFAMVGG